MGRLYAISRKMKNNKVGNAIFNFLDDIGVRIVLGRFMNWKEAHDNERHPNIQMQNSRRFFEENAQRIENVLGLLADEASKEVLKK